MALYEDISAKTAPFLENFKNELTEELKAVDRSLAAKGLSNSGFVVEGYKKVFLKKIEVLIEKIKGFIFNEIKIKGIDKSTISIEEIKAIIKNIITVPVEDFKNLLSKKMQQMSIRTNSIIQDFEMKLENLLNCLFLNYEQEFKGL